MDIYIPTNTWKRFYKHFCRQYRIPFPKDYGRDDYNDGKYLEGLRQVKTVYMGRRYFQLVRSATEAADLPIPSFHSTIVMNILGPDYLSIAYPKLTLNGEGILHPAMTPSTRFHAEALAKLVSRGLRLRYATAKYLPLTRGPLGDECPGEDTCPRAVRSFYDRKSLIVPVGTNVARVPDCSADWVLGGFGCSEACQGYTASWVDTAWDDDGQEPGRDTYTVVKFTAL